MPGKDDDLINWARRIPSGNRQERYKAALRLAIQIEHSSAQDDPTAILDTVRGWLVELTQHVDAQFADTRSTIASASIVGIEAPAELAVEPAPRVDRQELDRRAANLKKAAW